MNRIISYENKLMEYKKELNDLILEIRNDENVDKKLAELKINGLKSEINSLTDEIILLEQQLSVTNNTYNSQIQTAQNQIIPDKAVTKPAISESDISEQVALQATTSESTGPETAIQQTPSKETTTLTHSPEKEHNIENIIGKKLMGICASVLIFISLVSLSVLVVPLLGDGLKVTLMFLISFAFTFAGLYFMKKDNNNKLYLSLAGCGFGAIYISLLVSHLYFELISHYVLYILIILWIIILNLINSPSRVFSIIAQLGIQISIILGLAQFYGSDALTRYFFIAYSLTAEVALLYKGFKNGYIKNFINNIFTILNLIPLAVTLAFFSLFKDSLSLTISIILIMLATIVCIILNFINLKHEASKKDYRRFAISIFMYFLVFSLCSITFDNSIIYLLTAIIVLLVAIEYKFVTVNFKTERNSYFGIIVLRLISLAILLCITAVFISYYSGNSESLLYLTAEYIIAPLITLIILVYGFIRNDYHYKIFYFIYLIYFIIHFECNSIFMNVCSLATLILTVHFIYNQKNYDEKLKNFTYLSLLFTITTMLISVNNIFDFDNTILKFVIFTIMSVTNIIYAKSIISRNWYNKNTEKFSTCIANIINAMLMIWGIRLIANNEIFILHLISILITIGLFGLNAKRLLDKQVFILGIYVGIKYTILMLVILDSFSTAGFIMSICFFIFAIFSILTGFKMEYKSLRAYGLLLSLFSVVKLVLFDISYNDSISKVISFFVCGILCFGISMLYNNIDKKIQGAVG